MTLKALLVAAAFCCTIAAHGAEQPKLTAHLCNGTLTDQRAVGVSLGDCDLNDLGGGDLDQITAVCGQPHGVGDNSKSECRVCGYVEEKDGTTKLVEPMAVVAGNGKFNCIWRGD